MASFSWTRSFITAIWLLWAACVLLALQACDTSGSGTMYYQINYVALGAERAAPALGLFPQGAMAKVVDNMGGMGRDGGNSE
jgi:hypothetical protein